MNPLFPDKPDEDQDSGYVLPHGAKRHIAPAGGGRDRDNPATEMIRRKIDALYAHEPGARQEAAEARQAPPPRSMHQSFMYKLTTSGKSMPEIQAAWHNYYVGLPDSEKRQVWREFYSASTHSSVRKAGQLHQAAPAPANYFGDAVSAKPFARHSEAPKKSPPATDRRSVATIKKQIKERIHVSHSARQKTREHLQSLAFGIGVGALVLLITLFGLFNELVIAPFIRPSSMVAAAPIILSSDAPAPSDSPELIIPKINVQLPIVYGGQSLDEKAVQRSLEDGVFHYPTTATPGQNGNAAYFGHSSNNIFNKGQFKFAFVLLKELEPGDIFYLTYEKKVYTYKVYAKRIVNPDETWVLGPAEGKVATATLITCDPPGTTLHRLVVWGEQVSPDPSGNPATAAPSPALQTQDLPGKEPGPLNRFFSGLNPFD